MKLRIFSVYDSKAQAFLPPFFLLNEAMAMRVFSECAGDPQHQFCKHPQDFSLFMLGTFDDVTARLEQENPPQNLGMAAGYRNVETFPVNPSVMPKALRLNGGEDPNHQENN